MNEVFVNKYIENLVKEVIELNKTKVMLQTQLDIANKISSDLNDEVIKLREQDKQGRKKKEVNTSDITF